MSPMEESLLALVKQAVREVVQEMPQLRAPQAIVEDPYLTQRQAAREVDVDPKTISAWRKQGLKSVTRGGVVRIKRSDLHAFMDSNPTPPDEDPDAIAARLLKKR